MKTFTILLDEPMASIVFRGLAKLTIEDAMSTYQAISNQITMQVEDEGHGDELSEQHAKTNPD